MRALTKAYYSLGWAIVFGVMTCFQAIAQVEGGYTPSWGAVCNWTYTLAYFTFLVIHCINTDSSYYRACLMYTLGYAVFALGPTIVEAHLWLSLHSHLPWLNVLGSAAFTIGSILLVHSSTHSSDEVPRERSFKDIVCFPCSRYSHAAWGAVWFLVGSVLFLLGSVATLPESAYEDFAAPCFKAGASMFIPGRLYFFASSLNEVETDTNKEVPSTEAASISAKAVSSLKKNTVVPQIIFVKPPVHEVSMKVVTGDNDLHELHVDIDSSDDT
jgi:hypothetical protein